uniref:Uncharacterized protein n=1 Tax=Oryza meridionalis TaxID=40149 RepID=A0A0E0EJI1_9ORYZ
MPSEQLPMICCCSTQSLIIVRPTLWSRNPTNASDAVNCSSIDKLICKSERLSASFLSMEDGTGGASGAKLGMCTYRMLRDRQNV